MTVESNKLRGVNLGGWLVLEKWMTPSLFHGTTAVDEYTFMLTPGSHEKLERHRQSFLTEQDFKWISENRLNAVRLPVGYWILDGDGPFEVGKSYLDWAFEMAEKYRLYVLLDLHGAKGSQNGNDHSGRVEAGSLFFDQSNRHETISVIRALADRYKSSPSLWGIELLNEPKINVLTYFQLRNFYRKAYGETVNTAYPGTYVVFSDAFMPRLLSGMLRLKAGYPLAMDIHWYQFGKTELEKYLSSLGNRPKTIADLQRKQPVIIGEWSGMLSHETLIGYSNSDKTELQRLHIERQLAAYERAAGWFYWTYKTEEKGIWNFRHLVEAGMFPAF